MNPKLKPIRYLPQVLIAIIISLFILSPAWVVANKHDDATKILLMQKEMEHSDYYGNSDSIHNIKMTEFKSLLDSYISNYSPDKVYVRGALYYSKFLAKSHPHESITILHSLNEICDEMEFDSLSAFISHDIG